MKQSLYDYCTAEDADTLLAQWDNEALTPHAVSCHSSRKVWWRCERGHSWEAQIKARVRGNGCPVCSGNRVLAGANDLATTHPVLAAEWDSAHNGSLTPQAVTAGSDRKV